MCDIHLYTTFYPEAQRERREELLSCIKNNLQNPEISSVTVLNEGGDLSAFKSLKLTILPISKRPTYQDFFSLINQEVNDDTISIIANTDIFFDEHIGVLKYIDLSNTCLALARWDTTESIKPLLCNTNDSQDAWVFQGPIKAELCSDFPLGVPRCDNRLLYELQQVGYQVLNPAYSIKAFHLHKGQRYVVYGDDDSKHGILPPYRYLYPHNLFGFWKTLLFNQKHRYKLGAYRYDLKKLNRWWIIRLPRKVLELILKRDMPLIGYH